MKKFLYTLATVFTLFTCIADETQKNNPLVYQSGIYINRINSFDMKSGIAEVDFWYWVITEKEEASLQNLELSNGKLEPLGEVIRQQLGDKFYASRRYIATANCLIDTSRFPFDKQSITLLFEDGAYTSDQMTFKPDINNSGIDPAFKMNEWTITNVSYNVGGHNYPTSFGYLDIPSGQGSDYSQFCVKLELVRTGSMLQKLFKYFWAIFISVIVGLFALLIRVCDLDGRFGMAVGSLFANVGCSFILSEQLPQSPNLSLAELVSYVSLGFIMVFLVESIISLAIFNRGREKASKILDFGTFYASIIAYGIMWLILI